MVHFQHFNYRFWLLLLSFQETFPFSFDSNSLKFEIYFRYATLKFDYYYRFTSFEIICFRNCTRYKEWECLVSILVECRADSSQCSQYLMPDYVIFENYYYFIELGTLLHFASFVSLVLLFVYFDRLLALLIQLIHKSFSVVCALFIVISTF